MTATGKQGGTLLGSRVEGVSMTGAPGKVVFSHGQPKLDRHQERRLGELII